MPVVRVYRWQGTLSSSVRRHSFLLHASKVIFDCLVPVEVLLESVFVEVRLQREYFLRDLLVLALDPFQLRFSLVEVQALRFELDVCD